MAISKAVTEAAALLHLALPRVNGQRVLASRQDVMRAYRQRALAVHPDKNTDKLKADQEFKDVASAKDLLITAIEVDERKARWRQAQGERMDWEEKRKRKR